MLAALVFASFFLLLFIVIYGQEDNRLLAIIAGLLFFPHIVAFRNSPFISPHTLLLYIGLFIEFSKEFHESSKQVKRFPLKYPLLIFAIMCTATAVTTKGGVAKNVYDMFRYAFDIYGFFLLSYLISVKSNGAELLRKLSYVVVAFCALGFIEAALGANYPYKIVCGPFPIYQGIYGLNSSVSLSQSWRTRICITTNHPNTLSPILLTLFFSYLPYVFREKDFKQWLTLGLLTITICLCGSRAGMLCALVFTALYFVKGLSIYLKFLFVTICVFGVYYEITNLIAMFNAGQGSSLDLRQQQLLFSFMHFMQSPITGNGAFYMTSTIMETDAYGDRVVDNSIGSLESFLFRILIEFGAIGLFAQIVIILTLLIYFFRKRSNAFGIRGLFATFALYSFMFLSGDSTGTMRFGYTILGLCIGQCVRKDYAEEDGVTFEDETGEDEEEESLPEKA